MERMDKVTGESKARTEKSRIEKAYTAKLEKITLKPSLFQIIATVPQMLITAIKHSSLIHYTDHNIWWSDL